MQSQAEKGLKKDYNNSGRDETNEMKVIVVLEEGRALELCSIFGFHEIEHSTRDITEDPDTGDKYLGVCVRSKDIIRSVRLMESIHDPSDSFQELQQTETGKVLLIPIDFNPYSLKACKLGFEIAKRFSLRPVLLNAFPEVSLNPNPMYENSVYGNEELSFETELEDAKLSIVSEKERNLLMGEFRKKLQDMQARGEITDISFTTEVKEGVAEDVIKEFCRENHPPLIVMSTRSSLKKERELLGSVTAEVLDACLVPVFSIPEVGELSTLNEIKKIAFLCTLEPQDMITIESLMRMFDYPEVEITLIPISDKELKSRRFTPFTEETKQSPYSRKETRTRQFCEYFNKTYPEAHFTYQIFPFKEFMEDFKNYESQASIQMIIVSNKKRNILARLLRPGIAHKLLFERDLPMLVFPG